MKLFDSEDRVLFLKNFTNLFFIKILSKFIPLIITGYTVNVLGMMSYGKLNFARAIAFYFTTLITYGFDYTGTQQIIQARMQSRKKVNEIISDIFASQIITIIVCLIAYFLMINFFSRIAEVRYELLYFLGVAVFSALFPIYIFHALNEVWILSLLAFIAKVINCVLVPLLVKSSDDTLKFIMIHLSIDFVRFLIAYFILFFYFGIRIYLPKVGGIIKQFRSGFSFFTYQCYLLFLNKFPIIFLGLNLDNPIYVGIFSLCNQLFNFIHDMYNVVIQVLYPILTNKLSSGKNMITFLFHYLLRIIIPVVLIFSLIIFIFALNIVTLFTHEQLELGIKIFRMLIFIFPIIAINEFLGTNILIPMRHSKVFVALMFMCMFLSILFHIYFVGEHGIVGATYAICAQEMSLLILQIAFLLFYKFLL